MAVKIALEAIESSTLKAMGYDEEKQILALQFKTGSIRHYAGVPREVALELYTAGSRGQFFNAYIKGKYQVEEMTGDCAKCGAKFGWIGETCSDCGCAEYQAKPRRVLHHVWSSDPTFNARRRRTACGVWVTAEDVAKLEHAINCADCQKAIDYFENMEI